jgi:type I restriction enzyme, S subunit
MNKNNFPEFAYLPEGWKVGRLEDLTIKIQDGTHFSPKSTMGPYRYITSKNIRPGRIDLKDCGWISEQEHIAIYKRCDVQYNDVLLTKDGVNTGNATLNTLRQPFSMLSSVALIRTDDIKLYSPYLLQYFLSSQGQKRLKDLMSGNAITRLTLVKIKDFHIPFPSIYDQKKIAEILTTIDNFIEKTEALIAKYQTVKQGIMHDLFTRGVDAAGKLRPTFEDAPELYKESLIGWIPKEWKYTTVDQGLINIDAGKSPNCIDQPAAPGEWGVLKVSAVQPNGFAALENKVITNPIFINSFYEVRHGDVLITRSNTPQLVGIVCLVESPPSNLMLCDKTLRMNFNPKIADSKYMFWLLQQPEVRTQIEIAATGTSGSMKNITQPSIRALEIVLPMIDEQREIASRIQSIHHKITAEKRTVRKLKLQKSGLMQDLLTGKVRVTIDPTEEPLAHV